LPEQLEFITVTLVQVIASAVHGAIGYGSVIISAPLFVLINPAYLPGPALFASIFLSILMALRERQQLDFWGLKWVLAGRIPSGFLAAYLLAIIPQDQISFVFGLMILFAVGISLLGVRFPPYRWIMVIAGIFSGIMGTIAAIGGPPVALIYQDAPGPKLRSTMSGFFIVGAGFSLVALIPVGKYGIQEMGYSFAMIPGTLIGFLISRKIVPFLDKGYTRSAILLISALSAAFVIGKQIF